MSEQTVRTAEQNRIAWVDAAKGVGIILIVLGHILRGGQLTTFIYSFHVPLFFFLSGVTFHKHEKPIRIFIQNMLVTRVVPYYIWGLFSIFVFAVIKQFASVSQFSARGDLSIVESLSYLLRGYCFENSALWFIPCLIVTELLLLFVLRVCSKIRTRKMKTAWLLSTVAVSIAVLLYNQRFYLGERWVFNLATAFAMYPIMLLGYLLGRSTAFTKKSHRSTTIFVSLGCVAIGAYLALKVNSQIGYMSSNYGNVLVFYITPVLLIGATCLLCSNIPGEGTLLCTIGRKTMGIMLMHRFPVTLFLVMPYFKVWLAEQNAIAVLFALILVTAMCMLATTAFDNILPIVVGQKAKRRRFLRNGA